MNQLFLDLSFDSVPEREISYVWSEEIIERIRMHILKQCLTALGDDRTCLKTRTEYLEWIMDDSIHPFSFRIICEHVEVELYGKTVGKCDPEVLREGIIYKMKKRDGGR